MRFFIQETLNLVICIIFYSLIRSFPISHNAYLYVGKTGSEFLILINGSMGPLQSCFETLGSSVIMQNNIYF